MKLIQLEYFVRIVEEQSFTKAAEKLFISQPALSKAIQSMEKELKVSLFSRNPGVATLTEDGNTVYKYAKDILPYCSNRTDELIARLGKAKEPVKCWKRVFLQRSSRIQRKISADRPSNFRGDLKTDRGYDRK
mgnify:CR=1 FL=1